MEGNYRNEYAYLFWEILIVFILQFEFINSSELGNIYLTISNMKTIVFKSI